MHRIKCITISYLKGSEVIVPFLSLERLRIHDIDQLFEITSISFPALRHLDISGVQSPIGAEPSFLPPLESLGIRAGPNEQTWLAMMQGCSASLRSLYIVIDTNRLGTTSTHINLPRLHHLRLGYTSLRPSMTMLHLNVPRLRVYINPYSNPYYSILAHGLQTVTHLRIYEKPSLPMLANIRVLQLRLLSGDILQLLEELKTSKILMRHLESLEFSEYFLRNDRTTQDLINEWESDNYPGLKPLIVGDLWAKEPPWDPFSSVRDPYRLKAHIDRDPGSVTFT